LPAPANTPTAQQTPPLFANVHLTAYDPAKQDTLPKGLDDMGNLVKKGNAWGIRTLLPV
jgi:hypothetical protein